MPVSKETICHVFSDSFFASYFSVKVEVGQSSVLQWHCDFDDNLVSNWQVPKADSVRTGSVVFSFLLLTILYKYEQNTVDTVLESAVLRNSGYSWETVQREVALIILWAQHTFPPLCCSCMVYFFIYGKLIFLHFVNWHSQLQGNSHITGILSMCRM